MTSSKAPIILQGGHSLTILITPTPYPHPSMAFALAKDHLDHDEIKLMDLFVPRPSSSYRFYVKDVRLAAYGVFTGDLAIIERDLPLRAGRFALVSIDGKSRLVRILRDGPRFTFDDLPEHDVTVEVIGTATRILRVFVP